LLAARPLHVAQRHGKAIRAVARSDRAPRLVGIDVEGIMAISYGIGIACWELPPVC